MFKIGFRIERDGEADFGSRPLYNNEFIIDEVNSVVYQGTVGSSLVDFLSMHGHFNMHPFVQLDGNAYDCVHDDSQYLVMLRQYVDLCIADPVFFTESCFYYYLDMFNLSIPAMRNELHRKPGHEKENLSINDDRMTYLERKMRGFLKYGDEVYDTPLTVYTCDTVEDACVASLHFLITHKINIRKCKNCGKYFVAYYRSDTVYCDRVSPFNSSRTCKQDGPLRTYELSVKSDVLQKKIRNEASARRMRIRRNPDDTSLKAAFDVWSEELKIWKKRYKAGDISLDQFMDWLSQ